MICQEENEHIEDDQSDLHKYFSNGEGTHHDDDVEHHDQDDEPHYPPQPLSMQDLEEGSKVTTSLENKEEKGEFHAQFFWKLEDNIDIDDLLQDYN